MMPRQTGKSTSAGGYLLWFGMFKPDSTILVAAHKYAGAQEIMQRIRFAYEWVTRRIDIANHWIANHPFEADQS